MENVRIQSQSDGPSARLSEERKPSEPIYAQASSVGDQAAARDSLGFKLYVEALANFLLAENTKPPLTFSVEGSWGSGKSSFMLQLKNRIRELSPNSRAIDFNAWKYDKQEEMWAAFALNLALSLRRQTPWLRRHLGDFKLFFVRVKGWSEGLKLLSLAVAWLVIFTGLAWLAVSLANESSERRASLVKHALDSMSAGDAAHKGAPAKTESQEAASTPQPIHYWLANSSLLTAVVLIIGLLSKVPESFRKRLFSTQIEQYIDKPDYKGRAAFLDTFSRDFARTVQAYSGVKGSKIFVFIDDLDRCEAPKAADLMQAINLMISEGNSLIFILGLDRTKVAASIGFKYREMIPYLSPDQGSAASAVRAFGDSFLEKFIQLSFRMPISSDEEQARTFVDSLMADSAADAIAATKAAEEAEEKKARLRDPLRVESGPESKRIRDVVMMVRGFLEHSPRRIKNFLNSFRLSLYIASAQGLLDVDRETGESEVTPERLGKFLALTTRYPELIATAVENGKLFDDLEFSLIWNDVPKDEQAKEWLNRPGVRGLLGYGLNGSLTEDWSRTYSLKNFPAWKFESVLPSLPVEEPASSGSEVADEAASPGGARSQQVRIPRAEADPFTGFPNSSAGSQAERPVPVTSQAPPALRDVTQRRASTSGPPANSKATKK